MAGGYGHNPKGAEGVAKRIREIERDLDRIRQSITHLGIQIDPDTNSLVVPSGRDVVSGNFVHGATGFKLDGTTGTPEFNDLILRGGIVGDDALQHPTRVAMNFADVNSTNFTVVGANFAGATIAVPSGFTTAQVTCIATIGDGRTPTAGDSPLYGQAWIGKTGGGTTGSAVVATTVKDGTASSITMGWMAVLTGLTASDSVQGGAWAAVDTTTGWISGAGNGHSVVAVTFYR